MPKQSIYSRDPLLTNVSKAYRNDSYVADRIFRDMKVDDISGEWYVYDKGAFLSDVDTSLARGSKDKSAEIDYNVTLEPYGPLTKRSLKVFVPEDDVKRAPNPLSPRQDATEILTERFQLDKERRVANLLSTAATFDASHRVTKSGTGQWNDPDSDPLADIEAGATAIELDAFTEANTMLIDKRTWRVIRRHPALVGLFTNVAGGLLTQAQFLELVAEYGITNLIVANTKRNSAKPGQAAVGDWVWGKHAWLFHIDQGEIGQKTVTFGKNLYLPDGRNVSSKESWEPDGEWIRVQDDDEQKVMAKEAGYAIFNAIA